jgi:type I restriction enzyme, S subunit
MINESIKIPKGWKRSKLGDCLLKKPEYGINAPSVEFSYNLPTYIRITDISEEGTFIHKNKTSVNDPNSNEFILKIGDIVFARTGASTGKSYLYNPTDGELVFAGFLIRIRTDPEKLIPEFLQLLTETRSYWNWVKKTSVRSGQEGLNGDEYSKLIIPIPNIPEQQKISEIHVNTNKIIQKIDQLISKKKNIKQGTMQELLTGKRRLDGFSGEWDSIALRDILDYEQPTKYLVKNNKYNDIYNTPVLTAGKTFILGYTKEEENIFQNLPVIIFDDFTTASKYVDFPFKAKSSAMKMLKTKNKKMNLKFVYEKMQLINFPLGNHKRYWISEFSNLVIKIPEYNEQNAISQILCDMDQEIKKLKAKKQKYMGIKQGMIQKLITGEIRLA